MTKLTDELFKKIEKRTKVNKETILGLANKLQNQDLQDEKTIRDLVQELSSITNKSVSKDKEDKIVNAVLNNKVPKNLDKMF